MYLKPLKSCIEAVEEAEFDQLEPRLAPLLHILCMVWAHSVHYRTPSRIIVVLQEICNLLIRIVSFPNELLILKLNIYEFDPFYVAVALYVGSTCTLFTPLAPDPLAPDPLTKNNIPTGERVHFPRGDLQE